MAGCQTEKPYMDTSLPFEKRVEDLVERMTLTEKVSQMQYNSPAIPHLDIPEYNWWNECLHGVGRSGLATVYPQAIGMAAMWDSNAMYRIASSVSDEARAKYHKYIQEGKHGIYQGLTFWTPNINIFRDPRWGRGMETYGEDPYLTGELGLSFIKGLQGNNDTYFKLIATAKHFVVHSGPESNRHSFNAVPSKYDFLETYTPHFKKAVEEAGVYSVMCAYNRLEGLPCCGNTYLSDLLRNEWGFDGYIVSDCWAVNDFFRQDAHEVVNSKSEAAAMSVQAGTDLNCGNSYPALVEAVEKGYITEEEIDVSVKRLFLARMKLGMFDPDEIVPFSKIPFDVVDSDLHKELALEAAQKSLVLLKNENSLLPFSKGVKNVAVIGPNANSTDVLLGNYNGFPSNPITAFQGILDKLPGTDVKYAQGCHLAEGLPLLKAIPSDVLYTDTSLTQNGLNGEYYNNISFEGIPVLTRVDKTVDFEWWDDGPGKPINGNAFSTRWNGIISPKTTGKYAIGGEGFSHFKLWIDGEEIITYESEHHPHKQYEFLSLEAGKTYKIKIEYIQNNTNYALIRLLWDVPNQNLKNEALSLAKDADLVIMCMGLSPMLEGEEMKVKVDGFEGGDRISIDLPAIQTNLIKAVYQLGKPMVLVLMNGSAVAFNWEAENVPAIIEAWYPGQSGGKAIADIIFGDYNPAGRLPVTFYKSVDQIPPFEDYDMQGKTYRYFHDKPLYPFGYGLSYSTFKYSNLIVPDTLIAGQNLDVSVVVSNTSKITGDEVVQLYISHPQSIHKVAFRSLKGFQRISLEPGEQKTINFSVDPSDLAVLDDDFNYLLENGLLEISIGGKQPDERAIQKKEVVIGTIQIKVTDGDFYMLNDHQKFK